MATPDLTALSRIEEALLVARLNAVRASIDHAGEKGRALEWEVTKLLRGLLPAESRLGTGFVAYKDDDGTVGLSPQLDIVIYDALRGAPLVTLNTCEVYPLEVVYGYMEVKAVIQKHNVVPVSSSSLEACVVKNAQIRKMKTRRFYTVEGGSPARMTLMTMKWLSLRSYLVAFEATGTLASLASLSDATAAALKSVGSPAHLHGVLVPHLGFLRTRPVEAATATEDDYFHVYSAPDHPLLAFNTLLLRDLATFDRPPTAWTPAFDVYMEHVNAWTKSIPVSSDLQAESVDYIDQVEFVD